METKYILKSITKECNSWWWKAKLSAIIGTTFTKDDDNYISDVDGDDYPSSWLNLQPEIDYLIEKRGDLSARIDELNSERYHQEVKNDVANLDDVDKANLAEWLCEHLDIEIVRERNFDRV